MEKSSSKTLLGLLLAFLFTVLGWNIESARAQVESGEKNDSKQVTESSRKSPQSIVNELGLIQGNQSVIQDLELAPFQYKELMALQNEMRSGLRDLVRHISKLKGDQRKEQIDRFYASVRTKADAILLPHQSRRLRQLVVQRQLFKNGEMESLKLVNNRELMAELGISKSTIEKMKEEAQKQNEKIEANVKKMRKEAREKVLGLLTKQQRDQLEKMIGEKFEFKQLDAQVQRQQRRSRDDD